MTRAEAQREARRLRGDDPETKDDGPDPAEDPIVYLAEQEGEA